MFAIPVILLTSYNGERLQLEILFLTSSDRSERPTTAAHLNHTAVPIAWPRLLTADSIT